MIKKIKIISTKSTVGFNRNVLRDTTVGKIYDVVECKAGERNSYGMVSSYDTLSFIDDVYDKVCIWKQDTTYEVIEEDQSMTNNNQVNWDKIPEDVGAVVTYEGWKPLHLKMVDGYLFVQVVGAGSYVERDKGSLDGYMRKFGDRFHLRPSPIAQPTPEPPESTQVESSEVEDTTTPEFDWSSVEDDVEVVFLHGEGHVQGQQWYKTVDGNVMVRYPPEVIYTESFYTTLLERINDADAVSKCYVRPPAITTPEVDIYDMFKGVGSKPSISTILQEAQQSILKHHGVTGKVKFTVEYSE